MDTMDASIDDTGGISMKRFRDECTQVDGKMDMGDEALSLPSERKKKKRGKSHTNTVQERVSTSRLTNYQRMLHEEATARHVFIPDPLELERLKLERSNGTEGVYVDEWNNYFDLLVEYFRVRGTCNVPQKVVCTMPDESQVKLGAWLLCQRTCKKKGSLRVDREARLQALVDEGKLAWEMDQIQTAKLEEAWNQKYDLLLRYGEEHDGYCNVPVSYICKLDDGSEVKLGSWLSEQRSYKKKGNMRSDRLERLQTLVDAGKLAWEMDQIQTIKLEETWNQKFELMLQYGSVHNGNCDVPGSYSVKLLDESEIKLGSWVSEQRSHKKKGLMRPDREARIQALVDEGRFSWTVDRRYAEKWNERFDAILRWGEEHGGNCNVTQSTVITAPDGSMIRLGTWLHVQRAKKKKKTLAKEHEEKMQALVDAGKLAWVLDGGQINTDDRMWNLKFELLLRYGEEHDGYCNVPVSYICKLDDGSEVKLGSWLSEQRENKKKGKLRPDRQGRLQTLVDLDMLRWHMKDS